MENKSYSLREVAATVDLPSRRIQFYIDEGVILPDETAPGRGIGHKFTKKNILELYIVKKLVKLGFSLAFIATVMNFIRTEHRLYWQEDFKRRNELNLYLVIIDDGNEIILDLIWPKGHVKPDGSRVGAWPNDMTRKLDNRETEILTILNISKMMDDLQY